MHLFIKILFIFCLSIILRTDANGGISEKCFQPKESGWCRAQIPRWYFNKETGKCERFQYGGCDGNKNNFETFIECRRHCGIPYERIICPVIPNTFNCRKYENYVCCVDVNNVMFCEVCDQQLDGHIIPLETTTTTTPEPETEPETETDKPTEREPETIEESEEHVEKPNSEENNIEIDEPKTSKHRNDNDQVPISSKPNGKPTYPEMTYDEYNYGNSETRNNENNYYENYEIENGEDEIKTTTTTKKSVFGGWWGR